LCFRDSISFFCQFPIQPAAELPYQPPNGTWDTKDKIPYEERKAYHGDPIQPKEIPTPGEPGIRNDVEPLSITLKVLCLEMSGTFEAGLESSYCGRGMQT
jgi:hypothetical protein